MKGLGKISNGASSDAILLAFIRLVTMISGFVVTRILSQFFSKHDYGTYSQVLLLVSTISSLTILGMMDAANYFQCSTADETKKECYISTIFTLQTAVSILAGGVLLCLSAVLVRYFDNQALKPLLVFAAVLPFFQNVISMLQVLIVSVGKAKQLAIKNFVLALGRFISLFFAVLVFESITVVLFGTVLIDVLQIVYMATSLRHSGVTITPRKTELSLIGPILRYSIPMAVFTVISTINRDCDKYVISAFESTETLAVYSNASKVLPFDIIMQSFCTVLLPHITRAIAEKREHDAECLYSVFIEITYISTGILACGALTVPREMMALLYSEKYLSGLPVFIVYVLVDILRFSNLTLILSGAGRTKLLMKLALFGVGSNVILNIGCYKLFGVIGPAISTLVVTFVLGLAIMHFSSKEIGSTLSGVFDFKYLLKFILSNVAAIALFTGVRNALVALNVHYFIVLIIVYPLYIISMVVLNGRRFMNNLKIVQKFK